MPARLHKLTPKLIEDISAYIVAGGFPHVAAEACGIPRGLFKKWLHQGQQKRGAKIYRTLHHAVTKASAEARISAEIAVLEKSPRTWLQSGPGKEQPDAPGWTTAIKPLITLEDNRTVNVLADPAMSALITVIMHALSTHPDARKAVIDAINRDPPKLPPKKVDPIASP